MLPKTFGKAIAYAERVIPLRSPALRLYMKGFRFISVGRSGLFLLADRMREPRLLPREWKTKPSKSRHMARKNDLSYRTSVRAMG